MDKNNIDRNIGIVANQFANAAFVAEATIKRVIKFIAAYDVSLLDETVPFNAPELKDHEKTLSDTLNDLISVINAYRNTARESIKEIVVELHDNTNEQTR